MGYVADRMHFKGHVDQWCRNNCDPDKLPAMKMVHTYMYILFYFLNREKTRSEAAVDGCTKRTCRAALAQVGKSRS